jgi:hypothetical protein
VSIGCVGRLRSLEAKHARIEKRGAAPREEQIARHDESESESDEARGHARAGRIYDALRKPLYVDPRGGKRDARFDESTESESESDDGGGRRQREEEARGGNGALQTGLVDESESESSESSDDDLPRGDADNVARKPKGPPKPPLRRQWTHTTIAGRAERRLHRNTVRPTRRGRHGAPGRATVRRDALAP